MTTHESNTGAEPGGHSSRLRRLLGNITAFHVGLLGVLAVPGWLFDSLAFMQLFGLFFLAFLWPLVAPLFTWVFDSDEEPEPIDWIHMGDWRLWAKAYLMIPVTFLNPMVLVQDLLQLVGAFPAYVRNRGSFPSPTTYDQRVSYRLPVDGTWTVVNGGHEQEHSHSWFPVTQRYAYDFVITDEDGRSRPTGTNPVVERYYCYDEPVFAPADGVVVEAWDSAEQSSRAGGLSHPFKRDLRGGYVVLQHAPDEYSSLVHLVPGSLEVEPGEVVERGQQLARCGHSGNSSEPHLHFQVQDHPSFELAAGLPIQFDDVVVDDPCSRHSVDGANSEERPPDLSAVGDGEDEHGEYHPRVFIRRGQRVKHVEREVDNDEPSTGSAALGPGVVERGPSTFLQRFALGLCTGGLVAFVGGAFAGALSVALLLGSGAAIATGYHYRLRHWRDGYTTRPGGIGSAVGVALVALMVALSNLPGTAVGVDVQTLGWLSLVGGVLAFVVVSEYDRSRLQATSPVQ